MKYHNSETDIAIIGGGIGGLMFAHRISLKRPDLKVIMLEKGAPLEKRVCPIIAQKASTCVNCRHCAIMTGLGGAGAFSDGKYIISTEYGGWLPEYLPGKTVIDYIEQADKILVSFGASTERYMPSDELKKMTLRYDLHMLQAQVKHLGTDENFKTMSRMVDYLKQVIEIRTETNVYDIDRETNTVLCEDYKTGEKYNIKAKKIVIAVGRAGSQFFSDWCSRHKMPLLNNQVDIGVRVELPAIIWEDFSKVVYEPKIIYRSKGYGDATRIFCFNERGAVVTENTDGVLTVNGHSYRDKSRATENSNFALLTTIKFTNPFNNPVEYARHVASLANLISGGEVLVQRLGDLKQGRRTDARRLAASTTRPTLNAVPGDLSLCMPKRQLDNIIETLDALNNIAPGTNNYDTLLYGIECKYYSARPVTNDFELAECKGIYAIGDGAGFTRSLSQASANGLYVADKIISEGI
ncbi:MAG: FAD-dependent oxidoreductase [Clostridiales bacterium]|nr:FAD-dependent oxidoreductase [Clostridiales bacterium]